MEINEEGRLYSGLVVAMRSLPLWGEVRIKCQFSRLSICRIASTASDRGRWILYAQSTDQAKLTIDEADGFPRMYFAESSVITEIACWLGAREQKIEEILLLDGDAAYARVKLDGELQAEPR